VNAHPGFLAGMGILRKRSIIFQRS
jgi:hypothetical protein